MANPLPLPHDPKRLQAESAQPVNAGSSSAEWHPHLFLVYSADPQNGTPWQLLDRRSRVQLCEKRDDDLPRPLLFRSVTAARVTVEILCGYICDIVPPEAEEIRDLGQYVSAFEARTRPYPRFGSRGY